MEKSPKRVTRKLRDRKERKFYTDDWALGEADDEIEGPQSFDLEEKLKSEKFDKKLVREMRGSEFTLAYIQQYGFTEPLVFHEKTGLGLRIPGSNFNVGDVKTCVGSKRLLDVMDVRTQKNVEMNMKQWQEYYEKEEKDRLLNVISLEFSHTKLENYVESPTVVRQMDWVDRVWPRHLKNMQTESTNVMDEMMYPKVQKYCLMSVRGCYTDFHVDFGGTSVWYHILKGAKVFWLIPPTDKNLESYQTWVLSGKQGDTFFGDNVEDCSRVYLKSGDTFFIPSGWIHAVYTPKDSLVFGGNFLHSFGIEKQLKIASVEEQTKVPQKFRYPFFTEMLWYTLERYVHCLVGQSFIRIPTDDDDDENSDWKPLPTKKLVDDDVALTPQELLGLKAIVLYLHQLPIQRKNVPALIYDPVALLRAIRQIVETHRYDNPIKAITGRPILVWPGERPEDVGKVSPKVKQKRGKTLASGHYLDSPGSLTEDPNRKRTRCGKCQSCANTEDCNQCYICFEKLRCMDVNKKDAPKRRPCLMRECLKPILPLTASCSECGLDGWGDIPGPSILSNKSRDSPSGLMECIICQQIAHPLCIASKVNPKTAGILNEDLPNSWECPICMEKIKPVRIPKRQKSNDERKNSLDGTAKPVIEVNGHATLSATEIKPDVNGCSKKSFLSVPPVKQDFIGVTIKQENSEVEEPIKKQQHPKEEDKPAIKKPAPATKRKSIDEIPGPSTKTTPQGKSNKALKRTLSSSSDGSKPEKISRRSSIDTTKVNNNTNDVKKERNVKTESPITNNNNATNNNGKDVVKEEPEAAGSEEENEDAESGKGGLIVKSSFRTELSNRIMMNSGKVIKKPTFVVRPSTLETFADENSEKVTVTKKKPSLNALLKDPNIWIHVFRFLDLRSQVRVLSVCKDWNRIASTAQLWSTIDLTHETISPAILKGVVRRQPSVLLINWAKMSKQQLVWMISRLPQLKELSLEGNSWSTVSALKTCFCPALSSLNLGFVDHLSDAALREILAPPIDSRPGLTDSKSRLRFLKCLSVAGADISDVSLRYITQHAGSISNLDLSCCPRITDAGIAQLGAPDSPSLENLTHLCIAGCPQLTNISLDHLRRCKNLKYLNIQNIPQISMSGLSKFLSYVHNKVRVKSSHATAQTDFNVNSSSVPSSSTSSMQMSSNSNPLSSVGKSSSVNSSVVVSLLP